MGNKDFLNIDLWTLIFTWANLFLLVALLTKFLYNPVKKILQKRQDEVNEVYSEAETAKIQAEELRASYDEKLKNAREEAAQIVERADIRAKEKTDELISEAQAKSQNMMEKAKRDIELERTKTQQELAGEVTQIAVVLAERAISKSLSDADKAMLTDEFIDAAGDLQWK